MRVCRWILPFILVGIVGCSDKASDAPDSEDTTQSTQPTNGSIDSDASATASTVQGSSVDPGTEQASGSEPTQDGGETVAANINAPSETDGDALFDLAPGDPAPPVVVAAVVQGNPVETFTSDKVYVVEFWATWCGPCLAGMPHISTLQEEYGDEVQFIGVTREDEGTVSGFMDQTSRSGEKWTDVLKYTIARDDESQTSQAYMTAARQRGIPCAFIVGRDGKVEWIGHPAVIDEPLSAVVGNSWDVAAARKTFVDEQQAEAQMEAAQQKLAQAMSAGDYEGAVKVLDELLADTPNNLQLQMVRLQILGEGGLTEQYNESAAAIVDANFEEQMLLNQIAWTIAAEMDDEGRDLELAMKAARQASTLSDDTDAAILDTVARVFYEQGNVAEAVTWQKKAVESNPDAKELQETLAGYEAEVADPANSEN